MHLYLRVFFKRARQMFCEQDSRGKMGGDPDLLPPTFRCSRVLGTFQSTLDDQDQGSYIPVVLQSR